ncbi:MAG: M14 family zinc carboxypeptidase [Cyanobacteria bacterium J06636_16]
MEWTDLKRLDSFIRDAEALGACVEAIGISGEGRSLYAITVGNINAARTVVIVAGCHADEVIGPLAAMSMLQQLIQQSFSDVRFGIVPVADPDFLHRNANMLPTNVTLLDLLNLKHQRDLEGSFTTDIYPECRAIREWIQRFDQIDAYLSLHSAHLIAPGLFFYVGNVSSPLCVNQVGDRITAIVPDYIPLLLHDPTGLSQTVLAPGFFELNLPDFKTLNQKNPGSSLAFVTHQFQPQFVGASEMPLAIGSVLSNASLSEIDQFNREFKQTGFTDHPIQEISLDTQLSIMHTLIRSVAQCIIAA